MIKKCLLQVFGILILLLLVAGCVNRSINPCVKDGREYCITDEWIFSEAWYSCYLRGISCTQGGCWENARDEFLRAVHKRDEDGRWIRTYGMHRLPEYFPNRELGIAYYHLRDIRKALRHLNISLKQCESAKAKLFLNKARRESLLMTGEDQEAPNLFLDPYPGSIPTNTFILSGLAEDDTFVADVLIRINDGDIVKKMELSQPRSLQFQHEVLLQQGINDISIRVLDLLERESEQRIRILVDQEGPMIYFSHEEIEAYAYPLEMKGLIYDPSGVVRFDLNGKTVDIEQVEEGAYLFRYDLSASEVETGFLVYQADDSFLNRSSGTLLLKPEGERHGEARVRLAMASDWEYTTPIFTSMAAELAPVLIQVSQIPEETFEEEICPRIEILSSSRIREISINDTPILSLYGLHWTAFFYRMVKRYLREKQEGRFLFTRLLKLKEGENDIHIKVSDMSGRVYEKRVGVLKKTRSIHQIEERWRMALPCIHYTRPGEDPEEKRHGMTYQLMEAFVEQGRFRIIDLEGLPIVIDEKMLSHYLGRPLMGLSEESRIWIDILLLGYLQEAADSVSLSASLVDLETGEILATKDVCEEVDPSLLVWEEGKQEHTFHLCSALAAKLKAHFPVCEGRVIALSGGEIRADICKADGLKQGMKLLLYKGNLDHSGDYDILGDAKVNEVGEAYSIARLLQEVSRDISKVKINTWGVITR